MTANNDGRIDCGITTTEPGNLFVSLHRIVILIKGGFCYGHPTTILYTDAYCTISNNVVVNNGFSLLPDRNGFVDKADNQVVLNHNVAATMTNINRI